MILDQKVQSQYSTLSSVATVSASRNCWGILGVQFRLLLMCPATATKHKWQLKSVHNHTIWQYLTNTENCSASMPKVQIQLQAHHCLVSVSHILRFLLGLFVLYITGNGWGALRSQHLVPMTIIIHHYSRKTFVMKSWKILK